MVIVGKIAIKRNKKERTKKNWITIGLIAFIITMICEVILGNFTFLVLIVPFLYLLNMRNKMGKKVLYKDVYIRIENNDTNRKIEISNCEYQDRVLCSARFLMLRNSPVSLSYFSKEDKLVISCSAKKVLFVDDSIFSIFNDNQYVIIVYVSVDDAQKIADELERCINWN